MTVIFFDNDGHTQQYILDIYIFYVCLSTCAFQVKGTLHDKFADKSHVQLEILNGLFDIN